MAGRARAKANREIAKLSFCNSKRLPKFVIENGVRYEWVGIGWIEVAPGYSKEEARTICQRLNYSRVRKLRVRKESERE